MLATGAHAPAGAYRADFEVDDFDLETRLLLVLGEAAHRRLLGWVEVEHVLEVFERYRELASPKARPAELP